MTASGRLSQPRNTEKRRGIGNGSAKSFGSGNFGNQTASLGIGEVMRCRKKVDGVEFVTGKSVLFLSTICPVKELKKSI